MKKDPGVPSLAPFKDQILAEAQEEKQRRENEKLARKQQQGTLAELAASAQAQEAELDSDESDSEDDDDAVPELYREEAAQTRAYARSLRSVIADADILVQVLDARDPMGSRTLSLEKDIQNAHPPKKLVFVLNKIDLVPRENVEAWLTHLRRSGFPTLAFRSSTQSQRNHLTGGYSGSSAAAGVDGLLTLLKNYARGPAKALTVGVVGLPNVGKSSLINTLKRSKACSVAPTPGWTKEVQMVSLDGGLKIMDCPGVVLDSKVEPGAVEAAKQVLRSAVPVDKLEDPVTPVELLLSKCKKEHLMMLYNIPDFTTTQEFLVHTARARGRIKKVCMPPVTIIIFTDLHIDQGGLPDVPNTARSVIRDWCAGRIPYYTLPPATPSIPTASSSKTSVMASTAMDTAQPQGDQIVSDFAPEFDLDALLRDADSDALAGLGDAKTTKGVAMPKGGFQQESTSETSVKLLGEEEDAQMEDMPEADTSTMSISKKRKVDDEGFAESEIVSVAPKKKSVTFAGPSQQSKMFEDEEAPMASNKAMKLAAKKEKKRKAKASKLAATEGDMDESEQPVAAAEPEDEVDSLTRNLEARTKSLKFSDPEPEQNAGKDEAYDFNSFFGFKGLSS